MNLLPHTLRQKLELFQLCTAAASCLQHWIKYVNKMVQASPSNVPSVLYSLHFFPTGCSFSPFWKLAWKVLQLLQLYVAFYPGTQEACMDNIYAGLTKDMRRMLGPYLALPEHTPFTIGECLKSTQAYYWPLETHILSCLDSPSGTTRYLVNGKDVVSYTLSWTSDVDAEALGRKYTDAVTSLRQAGGPEMERAVGCTALNQKLEDVFREDTAFKYVTLRLGDIQPQD